MSLDTYVAYLNKMIQCVDLPKPVRVSSTDHLTAILEVVQDLDDLSFMDGLLRRSDDEKLFFKSYNFLNEDFFGSPLERIKNSNISAELKNEILNNLGPLADENYLARGTRLNLGAFGGTYELVESEYANEVINTGILSLLSEDIEDPEDSVEEDLEDSEDQEWGSEDDSWGPSDEDEEEWDMDTADEDEEWDMDGEEEEEEWDMEGDEEEDEEWNMESDEEEWDMGDEDEDEEWDMNGEDEDEEWDMGGEEDDEEEWDMGDEDDLAEEEEWNMDSEEEEWDMSPDEEEEEEWGMSSDEEDEEEDWDMSSADEEDEEAWDMPSEDDEDEEWSMSSDEEEDEEWDMSSSDEEEEEWGMSSDEEEEEWNMDGDEDDVDEESQWGIDSDDFSGEFGSNFDFSGKTEQFSNFSSDKDLISNRFPSTAGDGSILPVNSRETSIDDKLAAGIVVLADNLMKLPKRSLIAGKKVVEKGRNLYNAMKDVDPDPESDA